MEGAFALKGPRQMSRISSSLRLELDRPSRNREKRRAHLLVAVQSQSEREAAVSERRSKCLSLSKESKVSRKSGNRACVCTDLSLSLSLSLSFGNSPTFFFHDFDFFTVCSLAYCCVPLRIATCNNGGSESYPPLWVGPSFICIRGLDHHCLRKWAWMEAIFSPTTEQ